MELDGHARNRFRIVVKARGSEWEPGILDCGHGFRSSVLLHGMSGEQVAVYAVQPFPIALVVEVCFHSARDNLHLTDLVGIGFLIPGRQLALNVGEPRGEQVTVTPDAARVVREGDRAVEFAFSCPVDLGNVAEHLSVGIVGAQPGLFREVFDSAWGQMAVCAVNHNAVPVGIVRGLNPESRRVRVRMASLIAEGIRRGVVHALMPGESGHETNQQAASQQPARPSSGPWFLSHLAIVPCVASTPHVATTQNLAEL